MESGKIIELIHVKKVYRMGKETINAVDDVSFSIEKGEFCCLLGTSGSGKSTLLNLMAGIETVTSGKILIKGKSISDMNENRLARFRQRYLGFVFQAYNLIPSMTALENVELPLVFKSVPPRRRRKLAREMLKKVGLGNRLAHKPAEMSGGQQQRVGIARAFVGKPEIVFADEPTGNLDTKTTKEVIDLIKRMAKENNQTIVMVTHDRSLAAYADKVIMISDGRVQSIVPLGREYTGPVVAPKAVEAVMAEKEEPSPQEEPEEPTGLVEAEEAETKEEEPEEPAGLAEAEEPETKEENEHPEEPAEAVPEVAEMPQEEPVQKETTVAGGKPTPVLVKKIVVKKINIKELYQGNKKGRRR